MRYVTCSLEGEGYVMTSLLTCSLPEVAEIINSTIVPTWRSVFWIYYTYENN